MTSKALHEWHRKVALDIAQAYPQRDFKDIVGQRFGRLVAVAYVGRHPTGRELLWRCVCDCGRTDYVGSGSALRAGKINSCGCINAERVRANPPMLRHGMSKTATYSSWCEMRKRCENPKHRSYPDYGGRGIQVCERWKCFDNFLADMGERPDGTTIDRYPNSDGHYEPGNTRWATRAQQNQNRRGVHWYEFGGVRKPLTEWARDLGIDRKALQYRIDRWGLQRALTTPASKETA